LCTPSLRWIVRECNKKIAVRGRRVLGAYLRDGSRGHRYDAAELMTALRHIHVGGNDRALIVHFREIR
jgi:hypothetical protein